MNLNPYSNGILSDITHGQKLIPYSQSLNPYSNGILSDFQYTSIRRGNHSLNPYSNGILSDLNAVCNIYIRCLS